MKSSDLTPLSLENQPETTRILQKCPVCAAEYAGDAMQIVHKMQDMHLVHVNCSACKNNMLAYIMVSYMGLRSVGLLTDLDRLDVERLADADIFELDALLDVQSLLQNEPSRFIELILKQ